MTFKRLLLFALIFASFSGQKALAQETVEDFIISVVSNYKNPMAYYPLRKDIFLPTAAELDSLERQKDRPIGSVSAGSFIFVGEEDLNREYFVDAQGRLMFQSQKFTGLSSTAGYDYNLRKHSLLMRKTENLGRFLWYNHQFKKLNQQRKEPSQ